MNSRHRLGACPGCGLLLPDLDAPAPAHLGASPGCWALYGRLLVREYGDLTDGLVHRLTVDTYAVQHPGGTEPPAMMALGLHLIGLCLLLERGASARATTELLAWIRGRAPRWRRLQPPSPNGTITVAEVIAASTPAEHARMVERWARSVWDAWVTQHVVVRDWIDGDPKRSPGNVTQY